MECPSSNGGSVVLLLRRTSFRQSAPPSLPVRASAPTIPPGPELVLPSPHQNHCQSPLHRTSRRVRPALGSSWGDVPVDVEPNLPGCRCRRVLLSVTRCTITGSRGLLPWN